MGTIHEATRLFEGQARPLQFLVKRESSFFGLWRSLAVLCSRTTSYSTRNTNYPFRNTRVARFKLAGRSLAASFLLHCGIVLLLVYLPRVLPTTESSVEPELAQTEKIYFRPPLVDRKESLPRIAPAGPGARPGSGDLPDQLPKLGSTTVRGNLTIVSKPSHPDNFHQTIVQSFSPPDLKITSDVKLPNMVVENSPDIPKPAFPLLPSEAKPKLANRQESSEQAPSVDSAKQSASLTTLLEPARLQPQMPVPRASSPVVRGPVRGGQPPAPDEPEVETPAAGYGLVAIGIGPPDPESEVVLPPGNRLGEFSMSPAGSRPGSPGGSSDGAAGGASSKVTGRGAGGDLSTGVGPGGGGGGGGINGSAGVLSISGAGTNGEGHGMLDPSLAPGMVYAVPADFLSKLRKNPLVVSAGPIGGGGLNVYGALQCGKIYTVFLAMPGKNWTLQYCQQRASGATPAPANTSTVIHLEPGLIPPDAEERFDFQRLPVPPEKEHKLIILKGIIRDDGAVDQVRVYQGLLPQMDEAARVALSRWKFKPALRAGKPVTLEILVGIPAEISNMP